MFPKYEIKEREIRCLKNQFQTR